MQDPSYWTMIRTKTLREWKVHSFRAARCAFSRQHTQRIAGFGQGPWTKGTVYWLREGHLHGSTSPNPKHREALTP